MKKKIISTMLIAMMILCAFSTFAFAEGEPAAADQDTVKTDVLAGEAETEASPEDAAVEAAAAAEPEAEAVEESAGGIDSKISTEGEPLPPETVTIAVTAVSEAGGTAKVSWPEATGTAFSVTPKKGEIPGTAVTGITAKEYTFTALEPGKYTFTVTDELGNTGTSPEVEVGIAKPAGLTAYSAYESVALEWDPTPFADHYEVYMDSKLVKAKVMPSSKAYDNEAKAAYVVTKVTDEKDHDFYVVAVAADGITKAQSDTVNDGAVKRMYITLRFNQNRRLTSHDKYKKSYSFKSGQQVKAHGFGGGKYKFNYTVKGKECLFYVSFLRTRSQKAIYNKTKKDNWNTKEAEYFINTAKQGSKTKYYLWVSQYAQHVYVFKGSKGKWRLHDDWECSTGAAPTPSPVGFGKKIYKKTANRHGLGPWTSFQSWTSFHGSHKSWHKLWGKPVSHACIRCPSDKAMWIYKKVPLKTAVGVY